MTEENDTHEDSKSVTTKRTNLHWNEAMDEYLITAFYNQMVDGNKQDRAFTSSAYDNVVKELREKTKIASIDKEKVKNRWLKSIKPNFHEVFDLFNNSSGFAWSPITCLFEAEPEVWEALIEKKPTARKWMTKCVRHYDILREIFGSDRATGYGAETAKEKIRRWAREKNEMKASNISEIDRMVLENEVTLESPFPNCREDVHEPIHVTETSPHRSPTTVSSATNDGQFEPQNSAKGKGKKRKTTIEELLEKDSEKMQASMDRVADILAIGNEILRSTKARVYSEKEVFEELVNLGFKEDLRFDAYDFLLGNPMRVKSFFGCPPEDRKSYLLRKMRNEGGNTC